ncbi:hypothetical protein BpHYR1_010016 [Brachionus plicatilis]|uniref:Uncharacterized protein n=1 Tax=Brachionus plicatilis TaxID=10195 RepID=A0A3M7QF21_BRAPC|nr:hypothetical protein BpHYR1_010016 [Brachionus plicatilis]
MEYNSDKKPLHEYTKMKGMTAVIGIRLVVPLMVCVSRKWSQCAWSAKSVLPSTLSTEKQTQYLSLNKNRPTYTPTRLTQQKHFKRNAIKLHDKMQENLLRRTLK